ncbi:MAG TPA: AraC family transcriptional regulator [Solimonas sp.]|nr:AraC family transcriptional regulator [Solimonas sp.]
MNGATRKTHAQTYALRFRRVLDFIDVHLDETLPVERLSQVAHFSKFHFHRQFSDYVGMTPSRYIAQARLRRASYRLAFNPLEAITGIALQAGYERPESFSRAFKDTFGQSPSTFRKNPDWATWNAQFHWITRQETDAMQVRIVTTEPALVAVFEHRGDPALLNASVQTFIAWRKESGLSPVNNSDTYGVAYDDPAATPAEDFRFDICGAVLAPVPPNRYGVITKTIPGGRCAVVRHQGSPDHIGGSVYHLYRNWLPHSGEELRDFPVYFHYLNLRTDTPEHELQTDVHLPLR